MRRRRTTTISMLAFACLLSVSAVSKAQLSTNPNKFLGNITTYYNVDYGKEKYYTLWNQITCENETKWSSVQGSGRNSWNWNDAAYNYAKQHNFPFKFHTLVWGSQFPGWIKDLSAQERYDAIINWLDGVKQHYPDLEMIDVVNEAVEGHQQDTHYISEALGGTGQTGYDWIIKAFELAYERWPDAILIYNDFNTFRWDTDKFIDLVRTVRDAGAPIDAYGCQSHDLTDISFSDLQIADQNIQDALRMPMYITEYDIGLTDDDKQAQKYQEQIPYLWEKSYCAGITLWGYIYGATWINLKDKDGNTTERGISGIIKNGTDRKAMTWLRQYMATDAAKKATSPFPGMKKEVSLYIKPTDRKAFQNKETTINVRARMRTKTIETVKVYIKVPGKSTFKIHQTIESPTTTSHDIKYTPTVLGEYEIMVKVTNTDGTTYSKTSKFTVVPPRKPHKTMEIPGTVQAEDFDECADGITYHDKDSQNEGKTNYRNDSEGVDIVTGGSGYAIGYTSVGEWLEYTVNVSTAGRYGYVATVSSGAQNSGFRIGLMKDGVETTLATVKVPYTDSDWKTYQEVSGTLAKKLAVGQNTIRITITEANCNIDKIDFTLKSEVEYITDDDLNSNGYYYNFAGQRVNEFNRGITIKNGKKVFMVK